ncbi:MAG: hypothetical protein ABI700_07705 [Chloroflexota bacterium]
MNERALLDEALALALKLSPKERIRLIERVASSVEQEIEPASSTEGHWGQRMNALLDSLDTSDWEALEMGDPVEWLEQQRAQELKQRLGDWGDVP